ncbi:FtsX-like permease family protein [Actinomadura sp. WMMB 499]|uniref:FtsX-like permease family protein n=1 Tax=Actinomadura sp. WMMB 499 TaxID=1219491 RepID=UPI0012479527|nr:FtsX-like permease family protein [Actinomadura sp. WMMB 499]QFG24957.1 FtsX-like permease family protein [Actinomadura sp. WMMB 499]
MWLIARRSFAEGWGRLAATLLAGVFAIGLIAGSLQFALRAQAAVAGGDASEFARTDVVVQGGETDPGDLYAAPDGRIALDRVAGRPGVAAAAGDAKVPVTASGRDGEPIVPPAGAGTTLRPWIAEPSLSAYRLESGRAPARDGEVAVSRHVAEAGGFGTGDTIPVLLPDRTRKMTIVGIVTVQGRGAVASGDLLLAPPETVRRAARLEPGVWQSVWVGAAPGVTAGELRDRLARELHGDATVRTAERVRDSQSATLRSTGVSVGGAIGMIASVAVFVGLFVVANTFGTLVRQRVPRLALLGAIGATPRQLKRLIRFEALAVGAVASLGGLLVGYPVSAVLTRLFAADGFDISAADAQVGWAALVVPVASGLLVTQLAAWRAARRAAAVSPMRALRAASAGDAGRGWPRLAAALAVFACAWMFFGPALAVRYEEPPGTERTVGTAVLVLFGCMTTVAALAVLAPFFVGPLGGLVGRAGTAVSGEAGRLARATITRSPRRVSAAASSLMLGVALVGTTALLMLSVHDRFAEAGREVLRADHAIAATGGASGAPALPRDTAERAAAVPGVSSAAALTTTLATVAGAPDSAVAYLTVTGLPQDDPGSVLDLGGSLRPLAPGEIGLASPTMEAHGLRAGDRLVLRGERGRVALTVAGAYHDPSHLFADQALVAPATMDRLDPDAMARAVLVRGGDRAALARAVADVPGAEVLDRDAYLEVTVDGMTNGLTVVYGFIGMALVLALFGMATTVSMSVGERTREFGLLGAVGATERQIRAIVRWEAATVVLLGGLLGLGAALGSMAVLHAVTGSSFLRPTAPWWLFALIVAGSALVALATSALPARRASAVPVLAAAKAE